MNTKRVFTFWEPRGGMTAYLALCMKTWALNIPGYEIVVLDHANLDRYLPPGTFDMPALKSCTLPMQKDAIMVGVLEEHGGIFMDVDTIVTGDLAPFTRRLEHTEALIFNRHLAFMVARRKARLLTPWRQTIQQRLLRLRESDPPELTWDYTGNAALESTMSDMIGASIAGRVYDAIARRMGRLPEKIWRTRPTRVWSQRTEIFFRTIYRRRLTMLDRDRYGFIAEDTNYDTATAIEQYRRFWFDEKLPVASAFRPRQRLIALHNQSTPAWYKELTEAEVLAHQCLLSRTLRQILKRD